MVGLKKKVGRRRRITLAMVEVAEKYARKFLNEFGQRPSVKDA